MLLRRIARPMFASWFLTEGVDALRHPAAHADVARESLQAVAAAVPRSALGGALGGTLGGALAPFRAPAGPSDRDVTRIVRAHGAATATAAALLALGRAPRASALVLAGLTLPLAAAYAPRHTGRGAAGSGSRSGSRASSTGSSIGTGAGTGSDAATRKARRERFIRSLAFAGGALLVAADTAGRPSVTWQVDKARKRRAKAHADS